MLEVCSDTKEVKLTLLHPHGPSNSFKYSVPQNIYTIPMDDILMLIDPRTRSGCVYSDKKRNDICYQTASHCITTVTNLYYWHAFVTTCLYMHTFNLQFNQRDLCVCKPKSAEWASRCAILHGISTIIPQTPLATYLIIP